jgi:porin
MSVVLALGGASFPVLAVPESTPEAQAAATEPASAPACEAYARYVTRAEAVLRQTAPCDTVSPELGGMRAALAENGFGFFGGFSPSYRYDVLGHNETPQQYNGQNPTWRQSAKVGLTYDLTRLGFGGDAQLTVAVSTETGSFKSSNPNFLTMSIFAVNQRFLDGRVEVQYGYFPLIRQFYGMVLGGNSSAAALGPTSVIPVQLGLSLFSPSPAVTVEVRDASQQWYNKLGLARSASPKGFQYDLDENPTGFKLHVPGSRGLLIDEFGYKANAAPNRAFAWYRAGVIYNTSHYTDYRNGGETDRNYGGYMAVTRQLTQPDGRSPRGLYGDFKVNYAPADRNLYASDFQLTAYYLAPFDGRPNDMASVGFTRSYFSKYVRRLVAGSGTGAEHSSTALSVSYAAKVARGIYWVNGLTYQQGPSFAPARPDAALFQTGLNFAF